MSKKLNEEQDIINEKGSLGILALGDVGLRAWRKVRKEARNRSDDNKNKA